jgi:hypothetical protein
VIEHGEPSARKALLQSLVDEIQVASRSEIYPFFSLPVVRPPYGSVQLTGLEPRFDGIRISLGRSGRWRRAEATRARAWGLPAVYAAVARDLRPQPRA